MGYISRRGSGSANRIPAPLWAQGICQCSWGHIWNSSWVCLSCPFSNARDISTIKQAVSFNTENTESCKSEMSLKTEGTNGLLTYPQKIPAVCTAIAGGIRFSEIGKQSLWLALKKCQRQGNMLIIFQRRKRCWKLFPPYKVPSFASTKHKTMIMCFALYKNKSLCLLFGNSKYFWTNSNISLPLYPSSGKQPNTWRPRKIPMVKTIHRVLVLKGK